MEDGIFMLDLLPASLSDSESRKWFMPVKGVAAPMRVAKTHLGMEPELWSELVNALKLRHEETAKNPFLLGTIATVVQCDSIAEFLLLDIPRMSKLDRNVTEKDWRSNPVGAPFVYMSCS